MDAGNTINYARLGSYAQWAGAGLTALAITVALFKESILHWLRHPELTARIEARHPDCVKTPLSHENWDGSRYFLRLWIENVGKVRAADVEVFLLRAWVEGKRGWEDLPHFTPMNLRWSYSDFYKPTIYTEGVSPRMGRYCDFGAISDPTHPVLKAIPGDSRKTRLALQFQFLGPAAGWLLPGKYRFEILLAGSNCNPVSRFIELHLTGLWSDAEPDMFANGFLVGVHKK